MCGFFAEYKKKNYYFDKKLFLSSALKLRHRGPDNEGETFLKNFSAKFFRLSILDLSNMANQPMISKDKRYTLLFNGEIYNFSDLRRKYNLNTITNSDSEVILLLFQKINLKIAIELEGMFSIVIYDLKKNTCYFFRDRFGIKPLYYFNNNEKILFSSEIKPLLNYVKKKINYTSVLDYFLKQSMDNNHRTFFENIYSLEPGNYGIVNSEKLILRSYWEFKNKKKKKLTLNENKKNIKSLFFSSVKKHLISDRKIGFFF